LRHDDSELLCPEFRHMHPSPSIRLLAALLMGCAASPVSADWRDDIGFTRLQTIAGAELPAAPAQGITLVEGLEAGANYRPDTASSLFAGKTFTLKSGASGISSHANKVAVNFFATTSQLPGNAAVDLYSADNWLYAQFLNLGSLDLPATEARAVQNHSWIDTGLDDDDASEANRRLDYAIHHQGFMTVVGQNNYAVNPLPQLLGQGYHSISVGRSDGDHSAGFTTVDGTGRIKPDLVAPSAFPNDKTSWTTPMVAGAAGLLHATVSAAPYSLTGADRPRVVKALLMAAARKDNLASWSNTTSRPLDLRFGAGNLNVHHAYLALRAGMAAASNSISHGIRGWAAEAVANNSSRTWFFTIPAGAPSTPFCAALTWHRAVTTSTSGGGRNQTRTWDATLADLNLRLYQADGFTLGGQIAASLSEVDNVELIHQAALPPGNYAIVVENTSATATDIGLAWHSLPSVSIAASQPVAKEIDGQQATVTLTRSGDTTLPLQVPLTLGGTAVYGVHYQPLPSSVTFAAGQSSLALQVTPITDSLAQGERSLTLAVAADFALVSDAGQSAVVTIEDKPFDAWRFAEFPSDLADPSISGETADPDSDHLANLIEYALGLPPKSPNGSPLVIEESAGYLTISGVRNPAATDITWAAQVTGTMDAWSPANITLTEQTFTASDTLPINEADRRFIRLKISRP
jgi:hypothetical protein